MKPYSIDFREKVIKAYERGNTSIRKLAARFDVSKAFVQRLLKQKQRTGHVQPQIAVAASRVSWINTQLNLPKWSKTIQTTP